MIDKEKNSDSKLQGREKIHLSLEEIFKPKEGLSNCKALSTST